MEIGSEFWDVPVTEKKNTLFSKNVNWYLSGRVALRAIIQDIKSRAEIHTVAVPSWCCHTMIEPFVEAGIEVSLYPVYYQNGLVQEIDYEKDLLFVMDYFGYSGRQLGLSGYQGIIIRDMTHSIFSALYSDADYYFGSLRKWCGVWTGGYAWARDGHGLFIGSSDDFGYTALRAKAMWLKNSYIYGLGIEDKGYLRIYGEAEVRLGHVGICSGAERDIDLIQRIDVEGIRKRRSQNAKVLQDSFADWLLFPEMKDTDCPMFVPIFVPGGKRNELREYLIQHEIYCPVHWSVSKYHKIDEKVGHIYKNELSLVCDQRYEEEDMYRIVKIIRHFRKEL